jgi:LiaF transmembrane domain
MSTDPNLTNQTRHTASRSNETLVISLVVIAAGVVLLLNQLGLFPRGFIVYLLPLAFVAVGLIKLLTASGDRALGTLFVLVGVLLELNDLGITHLRFRDLWPLLIVAIGVAMLWNALQGRMNVHLALLPRFHRRGPEPAPMSEFDLNYIFGGGEHQLDTKGFRGGRITAVFGGFELDLTRADIEGNEAVLEANAVFGGGEIRVPERWLIVMRGSGIFGGYENKTRYLQTDPSTPTKRLIIKGAACFGGIEVKN